MTQTKSLLVMLAAAAVLGGCGKDDPDNGTPFEVTFPVPDAETDMGPGGVDMPETTGETPRPELDVVLVDREVSFTDGRSELLAFEVPDDAVSVTVEVFGPQNYQYSLARWSNGDGADLVPLTWLETAATAPSLCLAEICPVQFASSESAFAAQLPNNGKVEVVPGTHNIEAYGFSLTGFSVNPADEVSANVRVTAKRLPAPPVAGTLDINFFFTGARGWTAETAPTDEAFQAILTELQELYDQVDIDLGVITYSDIPTEYGVIENAALNGPELEELFLLSADAPRAGVNVFMVEELFAGPEGATQFGVLLGIAGGIPGPAHTGTPRSGVAINSTGDPRVGISTGAVIAHEVGHYLGLFHTTQPAQFGGPAMQDPIDDTPDNDLSMLMHATGEGGVLTPTQGFVMRHNTWVYHGDTQ